MTSTRGILADNLRALRVMHNLSQEDLAHIAGVTRETVNKWESGVIGNIRNKNLDNIRKHFELSIDDLRSETCGLSAQLGKSQPSSSAYVPLVSLEWLVDHTILHQQEFDSYIEVPSRVAANHLGCVMVEAPDDSMNRCFPAGSHVLIDPDVTRKEQLSAGSLRIVVTLDSSESVVFRSLVVGGSTAILSSNSIVNNTEDVVMSVSQLNLLGIAVWYQAPHEL